MFGDGLFAALTDEPFDFLMHFVERILELISKDKLNCSSVLESHPFAIIGGGRKHMYDLALRRNGSHHLEKTPGNTVGSSAKKI